MFVRASTTLRYWYLPLWKEMTISYNTIIRSYIPQAIDIKDDKGHHYCNHHEAMQGMELQPQGRLHSVILGSKGLPQTGS